MKKETQNTVSLAFPLDGLRAGNKRLPQAAIDKMELYGITIDEIIVMLENGVKPMVLLDIEENVEGDSGEINIRVKISLE